MIRRWAADGRVMRAISRPLALACALSAMALGVVPAPAAAAGGGAARCAAQVSIPAADSIGSVALPQGGYRVLVLDTERLSCTKAVTDFRKLLRAPGNRAPSPWVVDKRSKTFSQGAGGPSFRVERTLAATPAGPSAFQRIQDWAVV